jgi:ribonuclease HI
MIFDGAFNREGAGDGVWINLPRGTTKLCYYKLAFDCINNMVEYEALVLGLKTLKGMGDKRIVLHGDYEFIINQINDIYQANHLRLKAYRNIVLDLLKQFPEYNILVIPRRQNHMVDALATSASVFKIPIFPNKRYDIEVKHKPTILDNIKYWKVFEDEKTNRKFP